ncbi:MAG: hypothetical protein QNJ29_09200 [Rhizobiaceae bacterium]|nr:hypothetical protein [Rhizobiaceae bacterium]
MIAGFVFGFSLIVYETLAYSFTSKSSLGQVVLYDQSSPVQPAEFLITREDMIVNLHLHIEGIYRTGKAYSDTSFYITNGQLNLADKFEYSKSRFHKGRTVNSATSGDTFIAGGYYRKFHEYQLVGFPKDATPGLWNLAISDLKETNSKIQKITAKVETGGHALNTSIIWFGGIISLFSAAFLWHATDPKKKHREV